MNGFITMLQMNLKLLLRNKGFLAALLILPVLSILQLNINYSDSMYGQENSSVIHELSNDNISLLNMTNGKLSIKVYDCSNSKLADYILKELAKTETYSINRCRCEELGEQKVRDKALYSANHNVIGAVIYIPASFEAELLKGKESNLMVFEATKDKRVDMLENNLNTYLHSIEEYASIVSYGKEELYQLLDASVKNEIIKKTVSIEVGDSLNLTAKQKTQSSSMGYSLVFLSIGFLFSGVFIAATVIEERQNRVYNRFILSETSGFCYGLVKLAIVILTVVIETVITAVLMCLFVRTDFGISFASYLFMIFCLGLVFTLLSVVIGILTDNVLTSNYVAFTVWCLSSMLAGLYFPLDGASRWWVRISMLMPQRWVLKAAEMLMAGKSGVYSMFLLEIAGGLIIIFSIGALGMQARDKN